MQIRLIFFLSAMSVLAITHIVANEFYLYWTYLWLDIPMHFLGGICVALGISILPFFKIRLPEWLLKLKGYLLLVFVVGIIWEIFEFVNGISVVSREDFILDTVLDFIFNLLGGTLGYYVISRIKAF